MFVRIISLAIIFPIKNLIQKNAKLYCGKHLFHGNLLDYQAT